MKRLLVVAGLVVSGIVGCGGSSKVVKPETGPFWYEVVWTESESGERYMNLCSGFGTAAEQCVEVEELPAGCEISVDWHGEVRCEQEVN